MNLKERKAIIAGNWKLNKRVAEIPAFTQELQANLPAERCCDVVICAPYPLIAALETAGQGCHLGVGAQDVSEHQHGAFTGEVSAEQLRDLGAQYFGWGGYVKPQPMTKLPFWPIKPARKLNFPAAAPAHRPVYCISRNLH